MRVTKSRSPDRGHGSAGAGEGGPTNTGKLVHGTTEAVAAPATREGARRVGLTNCEPIGLQPVSHCAWAFSRRSTAASTASCLNLGRLLLLAFGIGTLVSCARRSAGTLFALVFAFIPGAPPPDCSPLPHTSAPLPYILQVMLRQLARAACTCNGNTQIRGWGPLCWLQLRCLCRSS